MVDQDPATRASLAELAARYALAGQPVVIAINNKAEGSAPLSCVELARAIIDAYGRMTHEHEAETTDGEPNSAGADALSIEPECKYDDRPDEET